MAFIQELATKTSGNNGVFIIKIFTGTKTSKKSQCQFFKVRHRSSFYLEVWKTM